MATKFYVDKNGVTTGPFRFEELARLNAQGHIAPDTKILSNNGSGEWTTWGHLAAESAIRFSIISCRRKAPGGPDCILGGDPSLSRRGALRYHSFGEHRRLAVAVRPSFHHFSGAAALDALGSVVHRLADVASKLPSNP